AVVSAQEFNRRIEFDSVILSNLDGDARGGAALSIRAVVGKPIKFVGTGEKLDKFEPFHPDRMAGRILGMGDVVSLVEKAQEQFDVAQQAQMQQKMAKGAFTLTDFMAQMQQMKKLGPMNEVLKMIPGIGGQLKQMDIPDDALGGMEAIIHSMTEVERENPKIVDGSRRRRIARGSGTEAEDVSGLVKSFSQMQAVMKQMAGMGMMDRMRFAKQMGQMDLAGGKMPGLKMKQRSKRLSKKDRTRKKAKRRR
ncbi:MAG: signal recognition particle protein, partial [Planctomycetes bacterium]|nr:signal recognition particle protein [Planctomycetota bacterium]